MVDIQSKEVIDKISDELKVQPAMAIPRVLADKIQLVYDVNPRAIVNIVETVTKSTTGAATVFTASTTKDTFITGVSWTLHVDVSNDGVFSHVSVQLADGTTRNVVNGRKLTLLEQLYDKVLMFDPPLKMLRGGIVQHSQTFTLGSAAMSTTVFGYTTEPQ